MNSTQAREKIEEVKNCLIKMKELTSGASYEKNILINEEGETVGGFVFDGDAQKVKDELPVLWHEVQKNVPPGFSLDGNLVRHVSFNELSDWSDISNRDVPREITKVSEYLKLLSLIEYIESLHPEVARVSEIILNGDIDAALKTVYSSLDSKIRSILKLKPGESTVPAIGKAFKDGKLKFPQPENTESVRSFLQGVIGYYRSVLIHNPLPSHRNRVDASLSLFGLAHEAFKLVDVCIR